MMPLLVARAVRAAAGLEARRPLCGRAAADGGLRAARCWRCLATLLFVDGASVLAALGIGLAVWLMLGALTDLALKAGFGSVSPRRHAAAACRPAALGVRHGAGASRARPDDARHRRRAVLRDRKHPRDEAGRDDRDLPATRCASRACSRSRARTTPKTGPASRCSTTAASRCGEIVSAKRFYPVRQMPTTEAGIKTLGLQPALCLARRRDGGRRASSCASGGSRW